MSIDKTIEKQEPKSIDLSPEGLGPWSFSKMKLGQNCPLSFYLKYVIKLKGVSTPPGLTTKVGKAAHLIIENIILGKSITDAYKIAYREHVENKKDLVVVEWKDHVETLEYSISSFRSRLDEFERKHKVKRYVQELRGGVTRDYQPTGFFSDDVFWRGVIDMGIQLDSGDIVILDHKTGAPAVMGLRNFAPQLNSYKILFHKGIEGVQGAQAGIHFIKDGEVLLDDYVSSSEIDGTLISNLEFYIAGVVDRIKELGYFKKTKGNHCKYCDYSEACKAGEFSAAELRSKKYFSIKPIT